MSTYKKQKATDRYFFEAEEIKMLQSMKEVFSDRFKAMRKKLGWTQKEMSDKLDISRQAIVNYEQGERIPDIEVLYKVVTNCECSAYYLLGMQNEMKDKYAHMTESIPLSEDALAWIDLNNEHIDIINKLLINEDFWDFIFYLSEIVTGTAFIDQFDHRLPSDYIDFIKYKMHMHIDAMIDVAIKQGWQNVDKEKMAQAQKKWSDQSNRYMRMGAKLKQKKEKK